MINTAIRQIAFHFFETRVHDERRKGEVSQARLAEIWREEMSASLGKYVNIDSQTEDNLMLCNKLLEKLEEGESFSNSLRLTSNSFDNLYSSLIKIGEITGNVKTVIKKLDEYLKQKKDMRDKLKAALAYPILVLITSIFVIAVILIFTFAFRSAAKTIN